jgi:hypothetical protein
MLGEANQQAHEQGKVLPHWAALQLLNENLGPRLRGDDGIVADPRFRGDDGINANDGDDVVARIRAIGGF